MGPEFLSPSVTMQDIADAARVSRMTVSRALKDDLQVSLKKRKLVQKTARELGYRPNPYVSAWMSRLSHSRKRSIAANLAILHFDDLARARLHKYFKGASARAHELGFQPEPFHYNPKMVPPDRLRKILITRGIRSIVIMPAPEGFSRMDFNFDGFAVAALGHSIVSPSLPRVASDIYALMFQALKELGDRGYSRIGLISNDYVNRLARFLYSAGMSVHRDFITPSHHLAELCVNGAINSPQSRQQIKSWIRREKLDAVLSPLFGVPLYSILKEEGFLIPEKLGYLQLLDDPDPEVTSLGQMAEFMGAKAVDMVAAMINRNEFQLSPHPHIISTLPEWHEGSTLPFRN